MATVSELNEFAKLIAEGKKQSKEKKQQSINEIGEFFSAITKAKTESPTYKLLSKVKENVAIDISQLFSELKTVAPNQIDEQKQEKIDQLVETVALIEQVEQAVEQSPEPAPQPIVIAETDVDRYFRNASFQQPNPEKVDPNIKAIQDKLKFLEQAVGKIAATGPGSGEVWFRWLDDVDRSTIDVAEVDQEHVLRYNSATKKFFFGELTGDHREINSFTFDADGPGINQTPRMLYWNNDEDCLEVDQQDGTSTAIGYDSFIEVRNSSNSTLTRGTVVRFSGAYSNGDYVPEVIPHIADGTIPPLYTVGIIAETIQPNHTGRATTLGKVRNVNTTGSDVSETWNVGDILYVNPTTAGKLTKVKPTAPNVVISVAAILKKHATEGILLVRPTIFPRLFYGTFSDKTNQTAALINTAYSIKFNTTEVANGHRRGTDTSQIIAENSGLYNYQFSIQFVSTNAAAKDVWIWVRKNGVDVTDSATRKTIVGNNVYSVASWNFVISMAANDYFQLMWATSDTSASIVAPPATAFSPAIPSVLLSVTEAAL